MTAPAAPHWHAQTPDETLASLGSSPQGLAPHEAARRLAEHGPNALPAARARHPVTRFLAQFHSALIYFLIAAALAAVALGHGVDAAVIVAVVLVNAIVGFAQEGKAERALDAIKRLVSPHANVVRDGQRLGVPVADVAPGDVVLIEAGDRVPADLRLIRARSLLIDEALLTGESVAAAKREEPAAADAPLGDRHSMAFSGTLVAAGQGAGVVVHTGSRTQIGRISTLLHEVEPLTTPLIRQMNRFGQRLSAVALLGAVGLFAFAVLARGHEWTSALMAVVALAVGFVPEGLPAVVTVTLAIGVQRMAARQAVIRRLPAVETLGATSVICTDKTGTLTRNEMVARRIVMADHTWLASGSGYAPVGALNVEADAPRPADAAPHELHALLRCAALCNDARLRSSETGWHVEGDPMEGALLALAAKGEFPVDAARAECPRLDEIPFDAAHRFMATLHGEADGRRVVFVKGAPEQVLQMCDLQLEHDGAATLDGHWAARLASAASHGERLLGFGVKWLPDGDAPLTFDDLRDGVLFLGLVGFIDPPRDEAIEAIAQCRAAGIAVKMITGDHAATATAIARQLGLADHPATATGADLAGLDETALGEQVRHTDVFARTSPEHKLRIVRALQAQGHIVAMTGDGVNDAPSLKQADVGVAMGIKGTEAAKEAAEMVLMDDNFASIVNAVHEGRTVYDNIRKVVAWTLPTNGGEVMAVVAALFAGFTLPMTTAQILWVNLVTAVTLGLALAFEPAEPGVMARPPRPASASLLSPFLVWRVVLVSSLFMAITLAVFFGAQARGHDLPTARTMVVNTLVVLEVFYLFSVRYLHMTSITWRGVLGTRPVLFAVGAVTVAQLLFTYAPPMQAVFDTRAIGWLEGAAVLACGVALLLLLEAEKLLIRRLGVFDELGGQASRQATQG